MSIFHHKPIQRVSSVDRPDYYFLEQIAPTLTDDQSAHLNAVKDALKDRAVDVLSGGFDPRAMDNFVRYRDKGHFFAKDAHHRNIFLELRGEKSKQAAKFTALPIEGYLGGLEPYKDFTHSSTVYNDAEAKPVYRIDRDESGEITAINYFVAGQMVRTDSYDRLHRLLMSEQYGAIANLARLSDEDEQTRYGLMSRTLYNEEGRPVFAQTYSPEQLWLLNEQAVPTQLFATEAGLMAWWLSQQLNGHNRIYVGVNDEIFTQLAGYEKLRPYLVPIIQDDVDPAVMVGEQFPEILINQGLDATPYEDSAEKMTLMPNWVSYKKNHTWSVYGD